MQWRTFVFLAEHSLPRARVKKEGLTPGCFWLNRDSSISLELRPLLNLGMEPPSLCGAEPHICLELGAAAPASEVAWQLGVCCCLSIHVKTPHWHLLEGTSTRSWPPFGVKRELAKLVDCAHLRASWRSRTTSLSLRLQHPSAPLFRRGAPPGSARCDGCCTACGWPIRASIRRQHRASLWRSAFA